MDTISTANAVIAAVTIPGESLLRDLVNAAAGIVSLVGAAAFVVALIVWLSNRNERPGVAGSAVTWMVRIGAAIAVASSLWTWINFFDGLGSQIN